MSRLRNGMKRARWGREPSMPSSARHVMPAAAAPEALYSLTGNCGGAAAGQAWRADRMDRDARSFGDRLRWWRDRRGLSQLALAGAAATTQRHVSFLESGRTAPSRTMVLRLADALALPLRQQNALLLAAGFAPGWRERDLAAPELAEVNRALT